MYHKWKEKYSLIFPYALARELSSHTPLFIDSGSPVKTSSLLRVENSLFERNG
jgi:hypothetical protein